MKKFNLKQEFRFNRREKFKNDSNNANAAVNFHLTNQFFPDEPEKALRWRKKLIAKNTIIKLTSYQNDEKIGTIYRQLSFMVNIQNNEIMVDYCGRLKLSNETEIDQEDQNGPSYFVEIKELGWLRKHLYNLNYPIVTIRIAYQIALVSLLIGLLGFLIALCQLIKCGC